MNLTNPLVAAATLGIIAGASGCVKQPAQSVEGPSASPQAAGAKHACKGQNECKQLGGCLVEGRHECKAKNDCKGQGGCKTS